MPADAESPTRDVEMVRTFDVVESTRSPSFQNIAAVARVEKSSSQSLDAVYFDTSAHDLAARLITVHRRTGGSDAGWHVRLPAGPESRTELCAPLGTTASQSGPEVPSDLLDMVLAVVRDRPLAPVARTAITRDVHLLFGNGGTVLAEFRDNRFTACASGTPDEAGNEQHWREWELKPIASDAVGAPADTQLLDQLSSRLLDAGATPARNDSALALLFDTSSQDHQQVDPADLVQRALAEQVDELLVWDRAVRVDADDAVHQMRVVTRKIRSLLQARDKAFKLTEDAWLLDELQHLAGVLGVARDAEVLAARYRRALDQLPPELVRGRARERLIDGADRRYRSGLQRSLIAMRSQRYFRLLDALDVVATEPCASAGTQTSAPEQIDAAYKRVRTATKAAAQAAAKNNDHNRDKALHRIRKGAKRLRYTAAATGAMKIAERAKAIQTLLGDHQDSVVSRAHLNECAESARAAGEDTFTYGLLYQQEVDLAQHCREQLGSAVVKLDGSVRRARH